MQPSSLVLWWLKIISIMGLVFQVGAAILLFLIALFWTDSSRTWIALWFVLSVGVPMFGMLYVLVKVREYLRDIVGALQQSSSS